MGSKNRFKYDTLATAHARKTQALRWEFDGERRVATFFYLYGRQESLFFDGTRLVPTLEMRAQRVGLVLP